MPDPDKHPDLHGNVPDHCPVALLLVDVLNALRFEGSEAFVPRAVEARRRIVALKGAAGEGGIPVISVNDNAGRGWSDLQQLIADPQREDAPGRALARLF